MLFLNDVNTSDAFEVVSLKFKDSISLETQQESMQKLNTVINQFSGFKSRDYFYSAENEYWIDFVVWSDIKLAHEASQQVMQNPLAGEVFALIDEQSMLFSHYQHRGGTR